MILHMVLSHFPSGPNQANCLSASPNCLSQCVPVSGRLLFVLDKDGCLDPFVADPAQAFTSPETVTVIRGLAELPDVEVALVSGRNLNQLKHFVGALPITFYGLHGNESGRGDAPAQIVNSPKFIADLELSIRTMLETSELTESGIILENKGSAIAIHWRMAPSLAEKAKDIFKAALEEIEAPADYQVQPGDMVLELRPASANKGTALLELSIAHNPDFIVCVGDDDTDLAMLNMAVSTGIPCLRVIVGNKISLPGAHRLEDPSAVRIFLESVLERRQACP